MCVYDICAHVGDFSDQAGVANVDYGGAITGITNPNQRKTGVKSIVTLGAALVCSTQHHLKGQLHHTRVIAILKSINLLRNIHITTN